MSLYDSVLRPLLFRLDPETAHEFSLWSLGLLEVAPAVAKRLRAGTHAERPVLKTRVAGLEFPNPVGLAAGLDKNAEAIIGLLAMGFGSIEVGTVTPRPQPGNDKPRVFRIPEKSALVNRMGFNNAGIEAMAGRLRELTWKPAPIGVNIGKNKDTPLERATEDYVACATLLAPLADYVAVNLSSPNTPGLRSLQEPKVLEGLLRVVRAVVIGKPLFLKIAPDLGDEAIDDCVDVAIACGVDGLICTNTTITRPFEHPIAKEAGGLSGKPLTERSTEVIRRAFRRAAGRLPIIGVGGILTGADAWDKVCAGATLVQIYTGFIYGGPTIVRRLLDVLDAKVSEAGLPSLSSAVGRNA